MYYWEKNNNVLGTDFNLYSSLTDAIADNTENAWTYCNYGGQDTITLTKTSWTEYIGAFYNCGPSSSNKGSKQYAKYYDLYTKTSGVNDAFFYIYTATLAPTTSPTAETTPPTALPTASPTPA
eukprot:18819_1